MKKEFDWGTWLSMGAVVIVCIVIAVKIAPGSDVPPAAEASAAPQAAQPKTAEPKTAEPKTAEPKTAEAKTAEPTTAEPTTADLTVPTHEEARAHLIAAAAAAEEKKDLAEQKELAAKNPGQKPTPPPPYRLNQPDVTVTLPNTLDEISGLSAATDPASLWAVHDERATLFRIAIKDGAVLQEIPLGKRGDYEGVEEADGLVYVGRSEGALWAVDPTGSAPIVKHNFQMKLGLACDLEGVAHEPTKKRLLLTCKNESSKSRKSNKAFEIYVMDLESKAVPGDAAFILEEKAIDEYIATHADQLDLKNSKGKNFAPSGIAVHPKTGELYVLSTRGKMLVVMDPSGALVHIYGLDEAVHPQPEGLTFGADGTLFVSSEAHGNRALLHTYKQGSTKSAAAKN